MYTMRQFITLHKTSFYLKRMFANIEQTSKKIEKAIEVKVDFGTSVITNLTTYKTYHAQSFPSFIQNITKCVGLRKSLKEGE